MSVSAPVAKDKSQDRQKAMLAESRVHMGYNKYELQIDHNAFLWFLTRGPLWLLPG